jgi:pectin methylesterase-like acyl-CoA thioesterase
VDPAQVVWVAKSGHNTFPSLSAALAAIGDATALKPYVIKIAPGTYTEPSVVAMKNFVDIEGSGESVTTIACACAGDFPAPVLSAGNITAELRHVTVTNVDNTGTPSSSIGTLTTDVTAGSLTLLHVTVTATGGTSNYGVRNDSSSPTMTNVTATASDGTNAYGVSNSGSSPTMTNVTATAAGGTSYNIGIRNIDSSPTIRNSAVTGSISNEGSSTAKIANTILDGAVNGGGFKCVGAHTSAFTPLDDFCQPYVTT